MSAAPRPAFHESPWPLLRNALVSYLKTKRPHGVQGYLEMDVTDALDSIHRIGRELRVAVSFHAFMLHCMVQALKLHPALVSYRRGNKLIRFEDIDVLTPIEKRLPNNVRIPVGYIVRGAQAKSLAQINWELRSAIRAEDIASDDAVRLRRKFARWPGFARDLVSWRAKRDPFLFKRLHGTVILTNVQAHAFRNPGAVLGPTVHSFSMGLGTITDRVKLNQDGTVVNRKVLVISGAADHDIIDGMVATRFIAQMTDFVESAAGLDDQLVCETRQLMAKSKQ